MAPSAANSWSRTGCSLAPHESLPTQKKWPVRLRRIVAASIRLLTVEPQDDDDKISSSRAKEIDVQQQQWVNIKKKKKEDDDRGY